jgi:hypothetical protein
MLLPFMGIFLNYSALVSFDQDQVFAKNMGKNTQYSENYASVLGDAVVRLVCGVRQVSRHYSRCRPVPMCESAWLTGKLQA